LTYSVLFVFTAQNNGKLKDVNNGCQPVKYMLANGKMSTDS